MTHDEDHITDQAAAYALGALEPEELAAVEAHLSACPACRQAVRDLEGVADLLAYAVPVETPPPSVRAAVMAEVAADVERHRSAADRRDHLPSRWRHWRRPVAVASAAAAVLLLTLVVTMQQALQTQRDQTTALAPHATQEAQLVSFLVEPASTVVALKPSSERYTGKGRLMVDDRKRRVMLVVSDLPRQPEGLAYRVWLRGDTVKHAVGRFNTREDGSAMIEVPMPDEIAPYRWVWVTIEPDDDAPRAPGDIVLAASF